jgi:hypothetical protein
MHVSLENRQLRIEEQGTDHQIVYQDLIRGVIGTVGSN